MPTTSSPCRVWSRFEGIKKDGTVLKLRIQEAPSYLFDQVIEFVKNHFITAENLLKSLGKFNIKLILYALSPLIYNFCNLCIDIIILICFRYVYTMLSFYHHLKRE